MAAYMSRASRQWATFSRVWWLKDARWEIPYEVAPQISRFLEGRHKPIYHPYSDVGDHVVVINARHIAFPEEEWQTYRFIHYTGRPGKQDIVPAIEEHAKDPTYVLARSVYHNMTKNTWRRHKFTRLHVFPDDVLPDDIAANISCMMNRQRPIPRTIDDYTQQELSSFPKLWTPQ